VGRRAGKLSTRVAAVSYELRSRRTTWALYRSFLIAIR
jgi:hypothetical protein